jgi:membrane protein
MTRVRLKRAMGATYNDVLRHHTFQASAALSYYFVLAIFPGLMLFSAALRTFPLPGVFNHVLALMARLLPPQTTHLVRSVVAGAVASQRNAWISVGTLGLLWVTSAAFDALIEALDIAYAVNDPRPLWKTRLIAIGLGTVTGVLLTSALTVMILGPRFAGWLGNQIPLPQAFVLLWPLVHWVVAIAFTVLSVEVVYFLAPNVKQRFVATLPGAVLSVGSWLGLSYLLGFYFRHFSNYDRIYGTLGGFIVFMIWLYWTSFFLLVGAELNAELAKESSKGAILARNPPQFSEPEEDQLDRAA